MIVVCMCGQKNRVAAGLVSGRTTASDVRCGKCKVTLRNFIESQANRNADIVLAIVELFTEMKSHKEDLIPESIRAIFSVNGMLLPWGTEDSGDDTTAADVENDDDDEDDEDDDEEDQEEDDDERVPGRARVTGKTRPKAKAKSKPKRINNKAVLTKHKSTTKRKSKR